MKVLLAGDTHGNIRHVKSLIEIAVYEGCDRIVQLGDFGFWPHIEDFDAQVNRAAMEAGITFYWLDGNHENFDQLEKEVDFNSAHPQQMYANLWYLPRGSTWEWDGCRFMALGGAYSIDKHRRVEGHSWWPQELITSAQVERAVSRGQVDIMLTHDTPEGGCPIPVISLHGKGDEISRGNRLAVSAVLESAKPRLLAHGHMHHRHTTKIGKTRIEGLDCDGTGRDSWIVIQPSDWVSTERRNVDV